MTDDDQIADSVKLLEVVLATLDKIGESDAAIKVQHALSILTRESIPGSIEEAEALIARSKISL